ncbi:hypothetical protein [Nostoc sp. MG11]|nr:hypothetical protein [Nostoc sp. MG11]
MRRLITQVASYQTLGATRLEVNIIERKESTVTLGATAISMD